MSISLETKINKQKKTRKKKPTKHGREGNNNVHKRPWKANRKKERKKERKR